MKRIISILIIIPMIISLLAGCSQAPVTQEDTNSSSETNDNKLNIVTTIFPEYDFCRQIAGDKANITMLLSPGMELHSYEPSPQDIIKIQNADIFIYNGGESDTWISSILESMDTSNKTIIKLMDSITPIEEETVEGMEEHEHDEHDEHYEHDDEEIEYDEHIWTSPKNTKLMVQKICDELVNVDSENADIYQANTQDYIEKLDKLDSEFEEVVETGKRKYIVFGDRFPVAYFAKAYGLEYSAAFPGCSTDTEPSAQTISYLINKIKEENIPVVFYIEFSNQKVADILVEGTNAKKLQFNSCHNVTKDDFNAGITYLDLMQQNLENLKEALN